VNRGQYNTLIFIVLAFMAGYNLYRYYSSWRQASILPEFEVFDVRTLNNLEPTTIVHYQMRNVGKTTAQEVVTAVSPVDGNDSLPAFFESVPVGGTVSVNRKIPPGDYSEVRIGVYCNGFSKTVFYTVEPNVESDPPLTPDFIVYNLSHTDEPEVNTTAHGAIFWIMNIGGSTAHNVNVSIVQGTSFLIPVLRAGDSEEVTVLIDSTSWKGLEVYITCDEGIIQLYLLVEYG
jgi:hypothetical protein